MSQLQRIAIAPAQFQSEQILLTKEQQHYLGRVLRLNEGDRFIAINEGKWWLVQLRGETAQILESLAVKTELPVSITLMMALPKGNGFDEVVRMCTELGVTCIAPILSDRTLLNPSSQKLERWQRIATEAAEQSERSLVPTVLEPITFSNAIKASVGNNRYLCEARGVYPHLTKVMDSAATEIVIATGSEGGWTQTEVELACTSGFQAISLGKRILRSVTAPIVALSLIAAHFES